jgi:hypothetical protein
MTAVLVCSHVTRQGCATALPRPRTLLRWRFVPLRFCLFMYRAARLRVYVSLTACDAALAAVLRAGISWLLRALWVCGICYMWFLYATCSVSPAAHHLGHFFPAGMAKRGECGDWQRRRKHQTRASVRVAGTPSAAHSLDEPFA